MATDSPQLKRVKRKIKKCQNPLFEKWLKEWKDEANKNGSEMQYCFNKALKSLQKFPLTLMTGKECIMLDNFGSKICQMLDDKLEEYKALNKSVQDIMESSQNTKKRKSSEGMPRNKKLAQARPESNISPPQPDDDYRPSPGSGACAILIAMLENSEENSKDFLTKLEIQDTAQKYCDSSFSISRPGSYYTAWSGMRTLIQKQLVEKKGNPAKFSLTERGRQLASKLKMKNPIINKVASSPKPNLIREKENKRENKKSAETKEKSFPLETFPQEKFSFLSNNEPKNKSLCQDPSEDPNIDCNEELEQIIMVPSSFKIVLLVDNQERDNKFQQANQMTMRELKTRNVDYEIRHLKVGDFIWIARNERGEELVLPYIVERKRLDDLASSVKDGRFHEQKFRLKQSGIENLIYLVEKYGMENQRLGLPLPTLMQAISNTQIVGRFNVRITNDHNHSMRYLDIMTTQLKNIFRNKTLMSCKKSSVASVNLSEDFISLLTFKEFNKGSEKNKKSTVRSMLVKHLLQLNGLSVEKAKAIVQLYSTPKRLIEGLKEHDGEKNISRLNYGSFNRSIGPVTAKQIKMLYTSMELH